MERVIARIEIPDEALICADEIRVYYDAVRRLTVVMWLAGSDTPAVLRRPISELHAKLSVLFGIAKKQQPQPPVQEAVPDQLGDAGDNPPVDPGV